MEDITNQLSTFSLAQKNDTWNVPECHVEHLRHQFYHLIQQTLRTKGDPQDFFLNHQDFKIFPMLHAFYDILPKISQQIHPKAGSSLLFISVPTGDETYRAFITVGSVAGFSDEASLEDQDGPFGCERLVVLHYYNTWYCISAVLEK